jgi:hypothetical protein
VSGDPLGADWAAAQARGVAVLDPGSWSDDGDAYTLAGVSRPAPGAPTVASLSPATLAVTAKPQEIAVTGTDFARGDRLSFGGATPPTNFHSDTELAVWIDPARWQAGQVGVLVAYSTRGPSNSVPFTFT